MAIKSSIAKARVFKIVMRHRWSFDPHEREVTTTRIYQSKKTYDRSWKFPFLQVGQGARYDGYELKHGKWVQIDTQTLKEVTWQSDR